MPTIEVIEEIRPMMDRRSITVGDGGIDFAYSSTKASPAKTSAKKLNSLIDSFPCTPSPCKDRPAEDGAVLQTEYSTPQPSSSTAVCRKEGENGNPNVHATIIPYESPELDAPRVTGDEINAKTPHAQESPRDDGAEGGWVGIGLDGEALAFSVSESPDASIQDYREATIPKAIDFKRFEFENLPIVEEDKISNVVREYEGMQFLQQQRTAAERVMQDVEDLSVDLSVLNDFDSIPSVMTKEGAISLAKRLEKMEHQLLELAGQTGKVDALRALAKATQEQSKRAGTLQKKVRKQEKKISTLNDLCQRLLEGKREANAARSKTKKEMEEVKDANSRLTLELHKSEERNEEMASQLAQMTERLRKMEEGNVLKSKFLLRSFSPKKSAKNAPVAFNTSSTMMLRRFNSQSNTMVHSNEITTAQPNKINELLQEENSHRAAQDASNIRKLEAKIASMEEEHAKKEKRSKRKIRILGEMKTAMEEQIKLLEGEDDDSYA